MVLFFLMIIMDNLHAEDILTGGQSQYIDAIFLFTSISFKPIHHIKITSSTAKRLRNYCNKSSERKHSWAARLAPRWPQFPVLQRFKDPNYHCTCVWHFLIAKEKKLKLGQVGVGSNIAHNHSSSLQGVISGHYLPKFICKVDQKWN